MIDLWLGIDADSTRGTIAVVSLAGERPWPTFKAENYKDVHCFRAAWEEDLISGVIHAYIGADINESIRRPAPVMDWLSTHGLPVEHFHYACLAPAFEDEVPRRCTDHGQQKAYILALCAYYRSRSSKVHGLLLTELHRLRKHIDTIESEILRIGHTLNRQRPDEVFCPF